MVVNVAAAVDDGAALCSGSPLSHVAVSARPHFFVDDFFVDDL